MEIWIVFAIVAVLAVAAVILVPLIMRSRSRARTERLQGTFGSEYNSTVADLGRKGAEAELVQREDRVASFELRPLSREQAARFSDRWTATQARFVDDPGGAIAAADVLLSEAMEARGYPVGDFEQRAADLSVTHSEFVKNYRAAHGAAVAHSTGDSSTEAVRQAMVQYHWLFDSLITPEQRSELEPTPV